MGLSRRLALSLGLVGAALLASAALLALAEQAGDDALLALCADALLAELWLASLALLGVLLAGLPARRALGLAPGRLSARQVALLALGTLAASHALDGVLDLSGLAEHSVLGELPPLLEGARGAPLALALLALGVAPGIAEELLCRGLVQRGLARRYGPAVAVPAAALLFGALHVEPIHGLFALLLGLYLGVIAHRAGSTRPAILCHALNNLAAVLLAALWVDVPWTSGWSVAGGLAIAIACLRAGAGSSHPESPAPGGPAAPGAGASAEPPVFRPRGSKTA